MENLATKGSKKATTNQQFEMLLKEIEKLPELARGTPLFGGNRAKIESAWESMAAKLNAIGPPIRKTAEWRKVWSDLRGRTKKKLAANKGNLIETGGGPFTASGLSDIEQAVDRLLNLRGAAVPPGVCMGLQNATISAAPQTPPQPSENVVVQSNDLPWPIEIASPLGSPLNIDATPRPRNTPDLSKKSRSKKRKRTSREHLDLFRRQIEQQKEQVAVLSRLVVAVEKQATATTEILAILKERNC